MELKTTVKCNKTLFHEDGSESFTKGNEYSGHICNAIENLIVINNQGELHKIGHWAKHFKIIHNH